MGPLKFVFLYFVLHYSNSLEIVKKKYNSSNIIVEDVKNCENTKLCINKCCSTTDYIVYENDTEYNERKTCQPYSGNFLFDQVKVYTDDIDDTGKVLRDMFHLIPGKFTNETFQEYSYDFTVHGLNNYLTEDGIVYLEMANTFNRWTYLDRDHFCVDYLLMPEDNSTDARLFLFLEAEDIPESNAFFTTALLISCVFLALTMLVYVLLPHMRNLCGMVRMAYVASQFGAFLTLAIIQIDDHGVAGCIGLTSCTYFFFLSTFCWMNVMSIDIWWTFRGYAKARAIHRRGETFKFLMYCLYAWGLPLLMTIAFAVLNSIDLSAYPWVITPNIPRGGCFLEGGAKLLYLYVPMLILILCNWIFFLMTAFNIWRLSRGTAMLNTAAAGTAAAHRFQRQRFLVYLKLSVIMGVNWILEVISSLKPELSIWYFTDAYNLLIGIAVFIIFVCSRKTKTQLNGRLNGFRMSMMSNSQRNQNANSSSSTLDSTLSRDETQVNTNPKYTSK